MELLKWLLVLGCAYLLGAIPFGYIVGRARGIDIREHGSGNVGFTNTWRVLGFKLGLIVLVCDMSKGWLSCYIGYTLFGEYGALAGGMAAIFAHTFSCFINFKGGKGIATGGGVLLFMSPIKLAICLGIVIVACVTIRYMSVGSILAALMAPILLYVFDAPLCYVFSIMVVAGYVIYKHIPNIKRLMNGTENKLQFGSKK